MSRARELADLSNVINKGANLQPNLIINGDMAVSQRGTSQTGITLSDYARAPDRYELSLNTLGTWTASQSTTFPDGFSNSYKLECTTADASPAAGDYFIFRQKIEGQNLQVLDSGSANAKKHTLSFWVRSSKTGTYNCEITHDDGGVFNSIQYTINTADTWERKTLTFDGYQTTAIANDNTIGYRVGWWLGAGTTYTSGTHNSNTWHSTAADRAVGNVNLADSTSNDWYITGVSLVVGDTAPVTHPYESYAENLERCNRYYYKMTPINPSGGVSHAGAFNTMARTSNQMYGVVHFPTVMRTTPSLAISATGDMNAYHSGVTLTVSSFTMSGMSTTSSAEVNVTVNSGGNVGQAGWIRINKASGYIEFDSEL